MERPPSPESVSERIAQATERLRAATERMSEAQALLVEARERLTLARLALKDAQTPDGTDRHVDRDAPDTDIAR